MKAASRYGAKPNSRQPTDRRYKTRRWLTVRLQVLNRDLWRCQLAPGCPWPATVADHIEPVTPTMPDWQFYSPSNLQAACRDHNLAKGTADRMARLNGEDPPPPRRPRTIFGGPRR
jgi:5-methylcytosine-specific restriction endonuclease McrA